MSLASELENRTSKFTGKSVLITKQEENDTMRIDHDALRRLLMQRRIRDKPVAIISIAGRMRTGKSFLLRFLFRYFMEKGWENKDWIEKENSQIESTAFPWRGGLARCTTGIRVLSEPFEVPMEKGGKMAVILMDTQGLFDHDTPEDVNKTLLTLSTLASSVQIFNAKEQIDADHLTYLKTCVDFALATTDEEEKSGIYLKLQRLMFLVRDFIEDDVDPSNCYGLEKGEAYLKSILDSENGGKQQLATRKKINKSFQDVKCFPMPHPGFKARGMKFTGKNSELEPNFLKFVKIFVEEIASPKNLVPKSSNEKYLKARELLNMITACETIFAQKLFAATDLMGANEKAFYGAEYEDAILEYDKLMKNHVGDNNTYIPESDLDTLHKESKKHAKRRYNGAFRIEATSHEYRKYYLDHLEKMCEEHFQLTKDRVGARQREKKARMAKQSQIAFVEYEKLVLDESSLAMEDAELTMLHDRHYLQIQQKYEKTADLNVLNEKVENFLKQLREDNGKRLEEQKLAVTEERKHKLYELCDVVLKSRCRREWEKELNVFRSDYYMEEAHANIKNKITEKYWSQALTTVEAKYREQLDYGLEQQLKKALMGGERMNLDDGKYIYPPLPGEQGYHDQVQIAIQTFAETLDQEMTASGHHILRNRDWVERAKRDHRKPFFEYCSKHLIPYYRRLRRVMKKIYEEARNRNEDHWNILESSLMSAVEELVLEKEQELGDIMIDRHINERELLKYYRYAKKDMKQNPPEEFAEIMEDTERARLEFFGIVNEMMDKSRDKMKRQNEGHKRGRNVIDSSDVPSHESLFKRAARWFKNRILRRS